MAAPAERFQVSWMPTWPAVSAAVVPVGTLERVTALAVAGEGLTWLWPDLQAVADSSDPDTALAAAESLERLREHLFGPLG